MADENSAEKEALERELIQLVNVNIILKSFSLHITFYIQDRAIITDKIQRIAATALAANDGGDYQMVIQNHLKFTQHDCYKSVTQRVQEKCFDLPVCYYLKQNKKERN